VVVAAKTKPLGASPRRRRAARARACRTINSISASSSSDSRYCAPPPRFPLHIFPRRLLAAVRPRPICAMPLCLTISVLTRCLLNGACSTLVSQKKEGGG
jgi:hypothetical protein